MDWASALGSEIGAAIYREATADKKVDLPAHSGQQSWAAEFEKRWGAGLLSRHQLGLCALKS